ncbi:unnamed protein product [marine sediment metagenome]|uniref:Uncharacterized protein n=1 Tax=marine sediment metagenome TaxID=412755 RepID=X1SN83_9ZZZZ
MTIDMAINELEAEANSPRYNSNLPRRVAIKLGIEALKEIRYLQRMDADFKDYILPGETE